MKKFIYLLIALFLAIPTTEGQILKNLKKKIEKKVEQRVTDNISDKAADEAEKSLNRLWATQLENASFSMGTERVDPAEIPASYDFEWEYTMNMKTAKGEMEMAYLLKENAPYFGIKVPQAQNMLTVLDTENDFTVMFMESEGSKMIMATKMETENPEQEEMENPYDNMEVEKIGTKTILGYESQGYRMENEDHTFTIYVTDEAQVSFNDMYKTNAKDIPKGLEDAKWLKDGKGLMMEMHMEDKKNPEGSVTMTCVGIEKNPMSLKKADYQGIGG